MFRSHHHRRKPDFLLIMLSLIGSALLATVAVHFHLLDHTISIDQDQTYSEQRYR
ncbi:hypothetical protein [Sedimenticola selenatireducens]|uniref:hypothetical protein n=1 Tax=Sedimenticola selenatireducens TaxID=191960 RepID=UPI0016424384|nr:hypothetical protein [Sedimenticola selenatireducens]